MRLCQSPGRRTRNWKMGASAFGHIGCLGVYSGNVALMRFYTPVQFAGRTNAKSEQGPSTFGLGLTNRAYRSPTRLYNSPGRRMRNRTRGQRHVGTFDIGGVSLYCHSRGPPRTCTHRSDDEREIGPGELRHLDWN
ncbi:hypothetical protein R3P38DRAFT_3346150, partial [Favolaschia claudopus]